MSIFWMKIRMWAGWCRVHRTYVVVFVEGVGGVGAGGICRRWEHPLEATNHDDIGRVTTT